MRGEGRSRGGRTEKNSSDPFIASGRGDPHENLTRQAAGLRPGQSGLLALDWNNGNRTILVDPTLSGLLVGQTLHTTPAEIYRALIEATAFGARAIIERFKEYGVPIDRVVCAGGIAEKNPLLMQIYADVTGCTMHVAGSSQACALGAAVAAAVVAGAHPDFPSAQARMTSLKKKRPNKTATVAKTATARSNTTCRTRVPPWPWTKKRGVRCARAAQTMRAEMSTATG